MLVLVQLVLMLLLLLSLMLLLLWLYIHAAVAVVVVLVAAVVVVPVYVDAAAVVTVRRLFASINCVFSSEEQMLLSQSLFLHHKVAFWKSYESKQNWVLCSKSEGACLANHLL